MTQRDDFTEALELAQRDEVAPEQIQKLARALAPVYGAALVTSAASTTASASAASAGGASAGASSSVAAGSAGTGATLLGQALATKAIIATLAIAAVGVGSFTALRIETQAAPRAVPVAPSAPSRADEPSGFDPGLEPPASPAAPALQAPERQAPQAKQAPRARQAPRKNAPVEAQLLTQAHAALRGDAAQALRLADEHRARFPHGALAQERELLAIRALEHLGRTREAAARRARALRELPSSAALERGGPE